MMNSTKELSFDKFFLTEFFNQTLARGKDTIPEKQYSILRELADYIIIDENFIHPLERLAQYHGANEFTIFLFDMMGRVEEYNPDMIYAALPDLADDFVNVYNLVSEDEAALADLQKALEDFRSVYAEKSVPKKKAVGAKEKTLTFQDFYNKEYLLKLNAQLDAFDEKKKSQYLNIINAFYQDWTTTGNFKEIDFALPVYQVFEALEKIFPADKIKIDPIKQMEQLDTSVAKLVKSIQSLEEQNKAIFDQILETGTIPQEIPEEAEEPAGIEEAESLGEIEKIEETPEVEPVKEPTALPAEEVAPDAMSIDVLLRDYFKSEVEDHLNNLQKEFEQLKKGGEKTLAVQRLIGPIKSLKEISMIHGYNGIEFVCSVMLTKLDQAKQQKLALSKKSTTVINKVLKKFLKVEQFAASKRQDPNIQKVLELLEQLEDTFVPEAKTKPKQKPEKKKKETDIAYAETAKVLDVLSDLLKQIYLKIQPLHNQLKDEKSAKILFDILSKLRNSTIVVFPPIGRQFFDPLDAAYRSVSDAPQDIYEKAVPVLDEIWTELFTLLKEPLDLTPLAASFDKLNQIIFPVKEEEVFGSDDEKVIEAFGEAKKAHWQQKKEDFKAALTSGSGKQRQSLHLFLTGLTADTRLLKLDGYQAITAYLSELVTAESTASFDEQMASEIMQTVDLVLERLQAQGRSGNCEDILSVLKEMIESSQAEEVEKTPVAKEVEEIEETPLTEEPEVEKEAESTEEIEETPVVEEAQVEEEAEPVEEKEEAEEDVEEMFLKELRLHLDMAKESLREMENEPHKRALLNQVESALHSVKSSAQLLGKDKIAGLAGQVEELAEIYGRSTLPIPADLVTNLNQGVTSILTLSGDPDADVQDIEDVLQEMLDTVPITDGEPEETEPEIQTVEAEEEEEEAVDEKPLFVEHEEVDEDLLEIFQEEAKSFLNIIDTAYQTLKSDMSDTTALNQFEYAAHSLKSAAKMLGFREIAQVTDSMERMTEAIKNGEVQNTLQIQKALEEGIEAVKKLSSGEKVSSSHLSKIINLLELEEPEAAPAEEVEEPGMEDEETVPEVAEYYVEEASELLKNLNMDLIELEKMPQSETLLSNILRNLHTLKGNSLMLKYERIGELCHRLEDYFKFYKESPKEGDAEMLAPAFVVLDMIEELLNNLKTGKGETADQYTARLAEIDNKLFLYQNFEQTEEVKAPPKRKRGRSKKETSEVTKVSEEDNAIKISTGYLDKLVNMASELVVSRTELATYFENLKEILTDVEEEKKLLNQTEDIVEDIIEERSYEKDAEEKESFQLKTEEEERIKDVSSSFKQITNRINMLSSELHRLSRNFEKNLSRIANISNTLHSNILKVRMVPIETLFNRFPRPVRDLAREQNKKIDLVIQGNETEMDRAMVEALSDPLLHIIRNAVDHGIEPADERKKQGKSPTGTVVLRARQDKNQVVIEVEDDGRGIDLEKIKKTITKRKLATAAAVNKMNEAQILDYLFYPEFTTRDEASKTSGRGIGLDVVSNQIQKLKGNIRIRTEKNVGTTFSIRVPLTLVISQALMTHVDEHMIAIPLIAVQESVQLKAGDIREDDNRKYLQVRGKLLPFVSISDILKFDEEADNPVENQIAVVLHDAGVSIALGIPEILGRQEIVIKTLGGHLQNVEYIAGGTILGSGEVALILDYAAVIRRVEQEFFGKVSDKVSPRKIKKAKAPAKPKTKTKRQVKQDFIAGKKLSKKKITDRKPKILIVDDSSSVRNFVSTVLEKKNFSTIKASDGATALEALENETVDLVITDLEMPKMHGFEFISLVRKNKKFKELPIVILTGKTGKEEQEKGAELGANAFIGKPFKETDLLDVIARFIETNAKKG